MKPDASPRQTGPIPEPPEDLAATAPENSLSGTTSPQQDATQLFTDAAGSPGKAGSAPASKPLAATAEFTGSQPTQASAARTEPAKSTGPKAPAAAAAAATKTTVFGDFRLEKKLGEGGMGAVFRACQISMDRTVALKLLSKSLVGKGDFVERFYREARTMAKLDHPNIVRGYAVGEVDGQHFVAMEFVDGQSMQKWMDKLGKLSVGDAVHVVLCAAHALQHAHEMSLIHRDIKPDNILVTTKGVVKVADLGLAKKTDDDMSLTQSGTGFGTPFYMPLEQYRDAKHVDARADIFALGVTLYYFLTGKLPFRGDTHFEVIKAKEAAKFAPARRLNPEVPEKLDLMIDKMIQKNPAHRYQTCAELIESLEALGIASEFPSFIGSRPAPAGPGTAGKTKPPSTLPPRSKPAPAAAGDDPQRDMWVLRYRDERGQKAKRQVSTGRLRQILERNEIDVASASIHRLNEDNPRPIASYSEFASLVQSRTVQAKADRRSQKLDTAFAKLEREQRQRDLIRKIKDALRSMTTLIVVGAIIAGLAFGAFWLWKNRDSVTNQVKSAVGSGSSDVSPIENP